MMNQYVLNLTLQLDREIIEPWIVELTSTIFPEVIDGEVVLSADVRKIINPNAEEVPSYAIQFTFPSLEIYSNRKLERLSIFVEMMDKSFANKYVYFATLMEVIHYNDSYISS
jgi:hypothetical protein